MKQTHLIATSCAALLAGTMFVAAQGMQKQAPGGDGGAQGQTQREPDQKGKQGQREQGRQQGQREQGKQQGTVGQGGGEQREQGRDQREQGRQGQQNQPKEKGKAGEAQRERRKNETIGQGQSKDRQGQSKDNQREGQQGQRDNQRGQTRDGGSANVTLTTEQRNRVRESVLTKGPRASNVNFAINVGVAVPRSVRIVAVDPILVEYYPRYRGFFYFIVNDQIVIVDKSHKIVAVINV